VSVADDPGLHEFVIHQAFPDLLYRGDDPNSRVDPDLNAPCYGITSQILTDLGLSQIVPMARDQTEANGLRNQRDATNEDS
jgi:hypothetical protein